MRYASVCDGIGAVHVAWQPLGWECAWTSEVEPFPAAVVDHHWKFKNLGDMTKLTEEMLNDCGPIDLLVGGTPCQSFSVAGLRRGLDDPRGNLALRFTQLVGVLRPTWVVWENVPGVLSSAGGRDFGTFLGALAELGYGFAYRVLDAQWFGVAQRRRRVFVVAHARDWRRAAAVLFEPESLFGNPPTRGEARQGTAISPALRARADSGPQADREVYVPAVSPSLKARDFKGPSSDGDGDGATLVPIAFKGNMSTPSWGVDQSETLQAENFHAVATPYTFQQRGRDGEMSIEVRQDETASCLRQPCHGRSGSDIVAFAQNQLGEVRANSEVMGTVNTNQNASGRNTPMVAYGCDDTAGTIRSNTRNNSDPRTEAAMHVMHGMAVRRLTPKECHRLQGFPDGYCDITYRGKPAADGPQYKALGNSMAVPVMRWIGERIAQVDVSCQEPAHGR